MPGFRLPVLSEDRLREFHLWHFPHAKLPKGPLYQHTSHPTLAQQDAAVEEPVEEDLGYYPDGKKRTLTDEQIAIFRHSEIQRMIRSIRKAAEEGILPYQQAQAKEKSDLQKAPETAAKEVPAEGTDAVRPEADSSHLLDDMIASSEGEAMDISSEDEENQSANPTPMPRPANIENRPAKRKWTGKIQAYGPAKKPKRDNQTPRSLINGVRHDPDDFKDEADGQTYRRQCREEDEVEAESVYLDY